MRNQFRDLRLVPSTISAAVWTEEHSMAYALACDVYNQQIQNAKGEATTSPLDCTQRCLDDLIAHRQVCACLISVTRQRNRYTLIFFGVQAPMPNIRKQLPITCPCTSTPPHSPCTAHTSHQGWANYVSKPIV